MSGVPMLGPSILITFCPKISERGILMDTYHFLREGKPV